MTLSPSASPQWELLDLNQGNEGLQEYLLFDSITSEFNDIAGFPIEFWSLVPSGGNLDNIYGENTIQDWEGPYYTKLLYEPSSEPELINMFGISSDDTIEIMQLTKSIFERDTGIDKPLVGSLIKTMWNNKTYEVVEVSSENKIFQGMKMIWDIICRPYRYDYQSDSADEFLFNDPDESDFPEINITTETETYETSGDTIKQQYGDNEEIEEKSNSISDIDTSFYGYDNLD